MISIFEILSSNDIAQTTNMEKFPTLYSTYMKVCPRQEVKALTVKNASQANVPSKENVFIYVAGYNNAFTQKTEIHTDARVNFLFIVSLPYQKAHFLPLYLK